MLTSMVLTLFIVTSMSPMNMAFMVAAASVVMSVTILTSMSLSFPSAAVIISFSSGMMILFCYCSLVSNYEEKSKKSMKMLVMMMSMAPLITLEEKKQEMMENMSMVTTSNMSFLLLSMGVVAMAMIGINKSVFSNKSSSMSSY